MTIRKEVDVRMGCKVVVVISAMVMSMGAAMAQAPAAAPQAAAPQAPTPQGAALAKPFPPVDPKNFTAASPTVAEVESFLKALWGFDENRLWSVAGILKTPAPGVVKVVIFLADKAAPGKTQQAVFFVTPDGKHAISGDVMDFGAKPFEQARETLEARADGPFEGAKSKDLEIVEFADLQCPHCKDVQETMHNLVTDFPQAHIVFQNLPLTEVHPYAMRAAEEGVCVRKAKGDAAFFTYSDAVYKRQESLTPQLADATLAAAVTAAGADPAAAKACAETAATKDEVAASLKLAADLGITSTPTLAVNGHMIPVASVSYETLKKIIAYQAGLDGIVVHLQPTLSNLK